MVLQLSHAFFNKLHQYFDYCMYGATTLEQACAAIREGPGPPSRSQVAALLHDQTAFHIAVPPDGQYTFARLLHEAAVAHFPDDEPLVVESAIVVLRTAVEVLVLRHDGTIFRDALGVGRSCLDRIDATARPAVAAEIAFRLGRLHLEPVASDPAYAAVSNGLDMCLADRHDQQLWVFQEMPASTVDMVPDRAVMLSTATELLEEAERLAGPARKAMVSAYLWITRLEGSDETAVINADAALAAAADVPATEDPLVEFRLRHLVLIRARRRESIAQLALFYGFDDLVRRCGLSQTIAFWVQLAPERISHDIRPEWHESYSRLAGLPAVSERSRLILQLRAGHCHPNDPATCAELTDPVSADLRTVLTRIEGRHPGLSRAALAQAGIHWLHHRLFGESEALAIVHRLVEDAGQQADARSYVTVRAAMQVNDANQQPTNWLSAVFHLLAATDLLLAGFPAWARHSLGSAAGLLRAAAASDEDVVLPPLIPLLERLVEHSRQAGLRVIAKRIIARSASLALRRLQRESERQSVSVATFGPLFALAQLGKSRQLTARLAGTAVPATDDAATIRGIIERLGGSPVRDPELADSVLDEVGIRQASYVTRFETRAGRDLPEILHNLRKIHGVRLSSPESAGASPAVDYTVIQPTLDPRSLAVSLSFVWVEGEGEKSGLSLLMVAAGRDHVDVNAALQPPSITVSSQLQPTFSIDGDLYELSVAGYAVTDLIRLIQTDPLVRDVSPEAAENLDDLAAVLFAGLFRSIENAVDKHGVDHVMIWPTEALHLMPYWLMPFRDGIVADHVLVTVLPTFQCLIRPRPEPAFRGVLAVGSSDGGAAYGLPVVPSLTTTALRIAETFGTHALVGRRANPTAVLQQMGRHEFVHIAAHGEQYRATPMYHCAYLDAAGGTEGRLYAHQVIELDLSAVRLITLNACEGNLLRFDQFDEIVGLAAALLHAGARAVAGALWAIRPEVGETFYMTLYQHLARGAGTLTAFRAAQIATRAAFSEYRDWGAFCFIGTGDFLDPTEAHP
ncbi:CHAT domain-containing protein [Actinoplanes sp. CA-015351]|uniref:CHAT domain-containing protein n=1 Tax=Actinoplanes sp. CA-015351 TaxID=3239897 RepID=UPI003D99B711